MVGKSKVKPFSVGRLAVRRKEQLQVPSCELHVRIDSIQTDVGACGCTPAIKDQSSQGTNSSSHPEVLLFRIWAFEKPWYVAAGRGFVRTRETC